MPSGARCKSPLLKDQPFCYFHSSLRNAGSKKGRPKKSLPLPSVEDTRGIQIALTQVLGALGSSSLNSKQAGIYLYGLQIATKLAGRTAAPEARDIVRSLSSDAVGDALAPEAVQCEPAVDCDSCEKYHECVLPIRQRKAFSQAEAWENEPRWQGPDARAESEEEEENDEELIPER